MDTNIDTVYSFLQKSLTTINLKNLYTDFEKTYRLYYDNTDLNLTVNNAMITIEKNPGSLSVIKQKKIELALYMGKINTSKQNVNFDPLVALNGFNACTYLFRFCRRFRGKLSLPEIETLSDSLFSTVNNEMPFFHDFVGRLIKEKKPIDMAEELIDIYYQFKKYAAFTDSDVKLILQLGEDNDPYIFANFTETWNSYVNEFNEISFNENDNFHAKICKLILCSGILDESGKNLCLNVEKMAKALMHVLATKNNSNLRQVLHDYVTYN